MQCGEKGNPKTVCLDLQGSPACRGDPIIVSKGSVGKHTLAHALALCLAGGHGLQRHGCVELYHRVHEQGALHHGGVVPARVGVCIYIVCMYVYVCVCSYEFEQVSVGTECEDTRTVLCMARIVENKMTKYCVNGVHAQNELKTE